MAKKNILWVDDDEDLQVSIKPLMEAQGWDVRTASSAEEGKTLAAKVKPDLIIMDVIMGGEHGFQAAEEIKGNPQLADVPVIMFSSVRHNWGHTTATRDDAVMTSAEDFVDKSAAPRELIETMRKYLA